MAATAAAAAASGGTGSAATALTTTSWFAAACGALSQYVKAAERARAPPAMPPVRPLLPLMPGADVDAGDDQDKPEAGPAPAPAQMTIVYSGRVLLLHDIAADKAAELLRLAAAAARGGTEPPRPSSVDLPVARKASLQRFMEKRKGRAAAARVAPYRRPDSGGNACPNCLALAL